MGIFSFHRHEWEDVAAHVTYWYRFDDRQFNNYQAYDYKVKWDRPSLDAIVSSGVKTAITQKCTACKDIRTQWVEGAFKLPDDDKEKTC